MAAHVSIDPKTGDLLSASCVIRGEVIPKAIRASSRGSLLTPHTERMAAIRLLSILD